MHGAFVARLPLPKSASSSVTYGHSIPYVVLGRISKTAATTATTTTTTAVSYVLNQRKKLDDVISYHASRLGFGSVPRRKC